MAMKREVKRKVKGVQRTQKMLRRPKRGETEEDLLCFQEQFLASGQRSAVSLAGEGAKNKRKQPSVVAQLEGIDRPPSSSN